MNKQFNSIALLALASASLLSSCSKDTDLYDSNLAQKEYEQNWTEKFGQVASDQDWNLATRATANVNVNGTAEVSVYSKGTDQTTLLARYTINGSKTISFDVPKGMEEVYMVGISEDGSRQTAIATISNNMNVTLSSASLTTKAATRAVPNLQDRQFVYAIDVNLFDGDKKNAYGNDYRTTSGYNHIHDYYKNWGCQVYATQPWGYGNKQQYGDEVFKDCGDKFDLTASSVADVVEGCENMYIADDDNITKLYPYTQDFKIITKGDSKPITLTGIYRNTSGSTALAYFYTAKGASVSDMQKADKYILIPNTQNVVGQQFKLVYYDPNNSYKATYEFPANLEIHFALVNNPASAYKWYDYNDTDKDICYNTIQGSLWEFSDAALNKDVYENYKGWTNMSSAALYKYHNASILSFEDWGGTFTVENGVPTPGNKNSNSIDWNDIAFIIDGIDDTNIPDIDKTTDKNSSWIIACEDLGSTDDYDFNDIVFEVSHVDGSDKVTVTPLAAGGTLKAEIYYGDQCLGEIHSLLGNSTTDSEGNYSMINTSTAKSGTYVVDRDALSKGSVQTVTLGVDPDDFTMSNDVAGAGNMGGFSIKVTKDATTGDAVTINAPTTGSVPQMFCLPGDSDWAWPTERTGIETAYPKFTDWVKNAADYKWYE